MDYGWLWFIVVYCWVYHYLMGNFHQHEWMDLLDHADRALAEPEKGSFSRPWWVCLKMGIPPSGHQIVGKMMRKPWDLMDFGGFPWFFRQTQMNFPGSDWLRRQETLQAGHVHLILDGYRPSSWITKIAACFIAVIAGLPSHSFGSQKRV